ncbi:hypothetical protein [Anaeromyxobacter sp. SG17]|uniref:hypothetical protein n=1 Tax=Anaeromyxobacter sp. SG17 TaxID=2925405 RepID=UPI0027DFBDC7|nr:hypothetical protein [Anaeromyxobacter sp. SG17]
MPSTLPSQMKAAAVDHFGGPEVLHTETLPVPQPGEHEILLRVDVAGVGVWDRGSGKAVSTTARHVSPT